MGSMFSKWQSKRKTLNVTAHIVQLKGKRDELEEHRNSLLRRMKQLETEIKNHVKQNERSQAMLCLRKRRLLAEHLSRIEQYLFQLLKVISDTEMAQVCPLPAAVAVTISTTRIYMPQPCSCSPILLAPKCLTH